MKPKFQDIPSLIGALHKNEILWDYFIGLEGNSKKVENFISDQIKKFDKKRTEMTLELRWWLNSSIKLLKNK